MASAVPLADLARGFHQLNGKSKLGAMAALALLIALAVGSWLWGASPEYKVLFSNVGDRDGGQIVTMLGQMNVPYKMSEGGGAILVPATQVHDVRLKLASQGLPRGGVVGFELMENQKLGATQFQEQVNYQRALEGELARSIQTLAAVSAARVHLAIPKPSVFLRDQQKPSASVIVNLNAGRVLERAQIAGIAHLVASAVPELPLKAVSVLDQNGNLLSAGHEAPGGLDAGQLGYVQQIEAATIKRVSDILEPIVGRANLRVQVTAELDFSQSESTAETYKPNLNPEAAVVRSEQKSEASEGSAGPGAGAQGVPGAASNQPGQTPATAGTSGQQQQAQNLRKESTVAYEVDKTVRHTKNPVGATKRLSAAVAVNYKKGKPYSAEEMAQIAALAKDAMGYSKERGDSINVVNAPFSANEPEAAPETALWQQPENLAYAREAGKMLLIGAVFLYLLFGVLRPLVRNISAPAQLEPAQLQALPSEVAEQSAGHAQRIAAARQIAKSDPRVVANVVKTWVSSNE